ncbi:MAG: phosphonate C-P lyase system protein PhnH [Bauldia sp.]|nr:phosphonate C-P lyase system protein PhnH [Bauldia sp.]
MIAAEALAGGFERSVFDAQAVFRAVLSALSRPGQVFDLGERVRPPAPLTAAAGAVIATLADDTTPVHLDAAFAGTAVADWIAFHTGAPLTETPGEATFAIVGRPGGLTFDGFATGTAEYPDRSATLIVILDTLTGGPALRLSGPGIEGTAALAPAPLTPDFMALMTANRALFPRGLDLILTAGTRVAGLPRTTRLSAGGV